MFPRALHRKFEVRGAVIRHRPRARGFFSQPLGLISKLLNGDRLRRGDLPPR
jgi:hypothetical protein